MEIKLLSNQWVAYYDGLIFPADDWIGAVLGIISLKERVGERV